jgi:hypothetical protein
VRLEQRARERRLAAILAADVVGSCRLIGINEEGTLAQLKALRKTLFDPKIAGHHGRIVKNTGDGALVEFTSVVDAVRCADESNAAWQNKIPMCRRIIGSSFASAFTPVILSSRTMIFLAMRSILQCVSKGSQNRVGFAFQTMSPAGSGQGWEHLGGCGFAVFEEYCRTDAGLACAHRPKPFAGNKPADRDCAAPRAPRQIPHRGAAV